ncbi:hypothetical protein ACFP1L_11935 [Lactiplantibacillus nangangensis]|uniref:Uncharacterized protein n=1 Tax=Lactiplantibacillus nangangensis TaxID=2559917 RepID=A0ABW1SLY9_9LACO|nr:hypothetical protein [Lactiplantibacillus nangangensis]
MTEKKTVSKEAKETTEVAQARQNRPEVTKMPMKRVGTTEDYTYKDSDGNETNYTFYFPGLAKAEGIIDSSRMGNGAIATRSYNQQLMDQVVVEPKTNWEYWEEHEGYSDVMDAADSFLGKIRAK